MAESLWGRICQYARENPDTSAILAPDRAALTYGDLKLLIERTAETLYSFGIGHGDRVATLFPFGADGAALHLALASCAIALPLDSRASRAEAEQILEASECKAIVFPAGVESDALMAARTRRMVLIELGPDFTLRGAPAIREPRCEWASLDDVAVVLS